MGNILIGEDEEEGDKGQYSQRKHRIHKRDTGQKEQRQTMTRPQRALND